MRLDANNAKVNSDVNNSRSIQTCVNFWLSSGMMWLIVDAIACDDADRTPSMVAMMNVVVQFVG